MRKRFPGSWNRLRVARQGLSLAPRLFGRTPRSCNLCGFEGKFLAEIHFPDIFTFDAVCPRCGSLPRNRLLALAIETMPLLGPTTRLLHFAPERPLRQFLQARTAEYVTTDLNPAGVDVVQDIESLTFDADRFDAVICSHVLEHVDHHAAMRQIVRVLAPGGYLLALFPIVEGWREHYENETVRNADGRALHFGKTNHLRRFGRSVRDDFAAAGFVLEDFTADGETGVRLGLIPGEVLFIARKPPH